MSSIPCASTLCAALMVATFLPPQAPSANPSASAVSLTLEAFWEPCRESKYRLFEESEVLRAPKPAEGRHTYTAADFVPFLPKESVEVGTTWSVDARAVLVFLRQFHPSARSALHHGFGAYEGTWACLRASSADRFEVLFRAHAEFELAGGVTFTPAQFEGRLVFERSRRAPLSCSLTLPNRNTNVDVNVPVEYEPAPGQPKVKGMSADIGWVPRMELVGGTALALEGAQQLEWTSSIPMEDARARLARRFYGFLAIEWLPFDQAVLRSHEFGKPLHVLAMFGALDDESC